MTAHTAFAEVAAHLGTTSERLSSIRNRLVKKDVLFVPNGGMVEFRIPLTVRYVREHIAELERRAQAKSSLAMKPFSRDPLATVPVRSVARGSR